MHILILQYTNNGNCTHWLWSYWDSYWILFCNSYANILYLNTTLLLFYWETSKKAIFLYYFSMLFFRIIFNGTILLPRSSLRIILLSNSWMGFNRSSLSLHLHTNSTRNHWIIVIIILDFSYKRCLCLQSAKW